MSVAIIYVQLIKKDLNLLVSSGLLKLRFCCLIENVYAVKLCKSMSWISLKHITNLLNLTT